MDQESVKVAVRLRPFNQRERNEHSELIVSMKGNSVIITNPDNRSDAKQFTFDRAYWSHDGFITRKDGVLVPDGPNSPYVSQEMVFSDLGKGILDNAFSGYACSLFAYGQTGSGKSYSVMGYGANRGIVPIICQQLFSRINECAENDKEYQVTLSMLEIYNEQLRDLLVSDSSPASKSLPVRQSPSSGFYVEGLKRIPVGSFEEIEQRMEQGTARRTIAATNMNATSSRAHTIVTLTFDQFTKKNGQNASRKRSVINLVDLAVSSMEENERLKRALQSNELPTSVITKGMSPEDVKRMRESLREELMAQMKANAAQIELQNQAHFNEELAKARQEVAEQLARKQAREEKSSNELPNKPYLSNLNEDPQLSGVIKHVFVHKTTGFGKRPPDGDVIVDSSGKKTKVHWIQLQGLGLADQHAFFIRHGKTGADVELRVASGASRMTKNKRHNCSNSCCRGHVYCRGLPAIARISYIPAIPQPPCRRQRRTAHTLDEMVDWEFGLNGNDCSATGFDALVVSQEQRFGNSVFHSVVCLDISFHLSEDIIIQKQLLELIPMVTEVNEIAEEMNKDRLFEIRLLPPTAQGLRYGEPKNTKIMIRMRDTTNNRVWSWDHEKFTNRRFVIQDLYQKYLSQEATDVSNEADPFWEPLEDRLVGVAPAFLQTLSYKLDVEDRLKIMSIEGDQVGTLDYQLMPCTRSGRPLGELHPRGLPDSEFVDQPCELLGKPFHFKIFISDLELNDPKDRAQVKILYRVFNEEEWTVVQLPPDYFKRGSSILTLLDHERVYNIQQITFEHLDYFENDCLCFLVYTSQTDKPTDGPMDGVTIPQDFSLWMGSVRASRRYSRVCVEELHDVNRLKMDLILMQRDLDRYAAQEETLNIICSDFAGRKSTDENYREI
ncbi:Kinesin protein [Fasciola gigantica]|uniref:Kinesin protein n=1 Tax=Fasciola gigantica TaxID=46835 RepID=A0A504YJV4_FASGI|nr:Kinesin protein [Fasciola gigantica]